MDNSNLKKYFALLLLVVCLFTIRSTRAMEHVQNKQNKQKEFNLLQTIDLAQEYCKTKSLDENQAVSLAGIKAISPCSNYIASNMQLLGSNERPSDAFADINPSSISS